VSDGYEILTLDEVETADHRGSNLIPIRYTLGFRATGINGWVADAGGQLIPPHEEDGGDEELYVVVRGRATFTVGDETADAPAGTLVFVQPKIFRTATAEEDATLVVALGSTPGEPFHGGGWDTFAVAHALHLAGQIEESRAVMTKGMEQSPNSWELPYNAACLEALAGNADEAFALLRRAIELSNGEIRPYLEKDDDLDSIRDDPRFQELLA
jgi:tetratricopeptide (TPR) repeat protein